MINQVHADHAELLDEAILSFEESWSLDSRDEIEHLLENHGLSGNDEAITELIRVDIELRYRRGVSVDLHEYFNSFSSLRSNPTWVSQIAFEDFRSRAAAGHSISISRWQGLPGVKNELWFQRLTIESSFTKAQDRIAQLGSTQDSDSAFKLVLESVGFRLVQQIGEGAFSNVYLATQNELADRYVVLKVVRMALAEPQNMAMLQHTNIVPIYSFHRIHSRSVICMPYAGSLTLKDYLGGQADSVFRGGQSLVKTVHENVSDTQVAGAEASNDDNDESAPSTFSPAANDQAVLRPLARLEHLNCDELAAWIFQRLAGALAHSHARGVLHGDLKPGNVLIRNDGEPALLDFNLSQSLEGSGAMCHAGGTLPYMAPETYRALIGIKSAPQAASDIYGLGVMLFEFVTGRLPYAVPPSIAPIDLPPAIECRKEMPGWRAEDQVSPGLRSIINRCLEFAPEDRYLTADQLEQDLDCEFQSRSLAHAAEPSGWRMRKWMRRHPRATSFSSVLTAAILVLIPLMMAGYEWREKTKHLTAVTAFESFRDDSDEELARMMADPIRERKASVQSALDVLNAHGVLANNGFQKFISPQMNGEERSQVSSVLKRHAAQAGFFEVQLLQREQRRNSLTDSDLKPLKNLVSLVNQASLDRPSRAGIFLRSELARLAGDSETADDLLAQANKIDLEGFDETEIYIEGVRLLSQDKHEEARKMFASIADQDQTPSALRWTSLAMSELKAKRFEDAKLSLTQSINRAPNSAALHLYRGQAFHALRDGDHAIADFTRAYELNSKLTGALGFRASIYEKRGEFEEVIEDTTQMLKQEPENIFALLTRAKARRRLGMETLADNDMEKAMQAELTTNKSLTLRARTIRDKHPLAALDDYKKAIELDPQNTITMHQVALLLAERLDRSEEAIQIYDEILKIKPVYSEVRINRALLLARTGRIGYARAEARKVISRKISARTMYKAASVFALAGGEANEELALLLLSQTVGEVDLAEDLSNSEDFDSIRDSEKFKAILKTHQISMEKPARGWQK